MNSQDQQKRQLLSWIEKVKSGNGLTYPDGPFTEELADTLVNFRQKTLEDSEE